MPATAPLAAAIATAVSLRALIAALWWKLRGEAAFLVPDSTGYLALSKSMTQGFGFAQPDGPELFRAPGYPFMLMPGVIAGHPILYALALQLLFTGGIVALTFAIVRTLTGNLRTAAIGAFVVALEPTLLLWSLEVMPETVLAFCLLGFVWAALRLLDTASPQWSLAAALFLSAAAYVKPIAYPLVVVLIAVGLAYSVKQGHRRMRLAAATAAVTCLSLVGVWQMRNYAQTGYLGFSTLFDHAVYISAGGSLAARKEHRSFGTVRVGLYDRARAHPEPVRYDFMRREGWTSIRRKPIDYLQVHLQGMIRTALDPGAIEWLRAFGTAERHGGVDKAIDAGLWAAIRDHLGSNSKALWGSIALSPFVAVLTVLPILAATRLDRARRTPFILMAGVVLFFLAAGGGVPGMSRFRAPVVPLLVIMSALAWPRTKQ
jgi:4-amino-4-deoxy-L-arabinose transferase-like glycosyltransferase